MKKNIFSLFLILVLCATLFNGCKKDKGDPPDLPPKESMILDFSNFISTKKSLNTETVTKGTNTTNWDYAAMIVGDWNDINTAYLTIPMQAYEIALSKTASYVSSKTWQWSFNIFVSSASYPIRLVGSEKSSSVEWKMYVTSAGNNGTEEFLWMTGTSKTDGTSGQWIFYQSPLVTDELLQVDWTKSNNTITSVKYTYIKDTSFKNSYIVYGTSSDTFNAYFTVHYYDAGTAAFSDVSIEWSTSGLNGKVKSSDYLLGDWYCWDINKLNIDCQ